MVTRNLRKATEHFHVTYVGGDYSNNLIAKDAEIHLEDDRHIIDLDVSKNFRTRADDVRYDADQLLDRVRESQVELVQIFDPTASAIMHFWDDREIPALFIRLRFGKVAYESEVTPRNGDHSLFLKCYGEFLRV
jgi:hypothetical protein